MILNKLGVKDLFRWALKIIHVSWFLLKPNWIKVYMNGAAQGYSGPTRRGGVLGLFM